MVNYLWIDDIRCYYADHPTDHVLNVCDQLEIPNCICDEAILDTT